MTDKPMSDEEFLLYCETHCLSPRAAFVPAQLARLHRLAGYEEAAEIWDKAPNKIIDGWKTTVLTLIRKARERMTTKQAYLGDGVYAQFDGYYIWVYTNNGVEQSDKIAFEPEVLANLNNYARECYKHE